MFEFLAKTIGGLVKDVVTIVEDTATEVSNIPDKIKQGYEEGLFIKPNNEESDKDSSK